MTFTAALLYITLRQIATSIPQWKKDVDNWIKDDIKGFIKFKEDVFKTVESSKKKSLNDGFEIIHPKQ